MINSAKSALVVIPARGGSKGIPRKNLRPLAGKPLIYYAIGTALRANGIQDVVVSTDDSEISLFAERFGAEVIMRPPDLAGDEVTLDPVICHVVETIEKDGRSFDIVVTLQPTSPLLKASNIEEALAFFDDPQVETVISAVDDRHLRWNCIHDRYEPAYEQRINRQQLPPTFKETGAIIACRRKVLESGSRIGKKVNLLVTLPDVSVDIDSVTDFFICESLMKRKRIAFAVVGRNQLGMGHAYRTVMLAHELIHHDVFFVCEERDDLAIAYIAEHNYPVVTCAQGKLPATLLKRKPELVINDILDTDADYVITLKKAGIRVVNFEDMGLGAEVADLVINALYPHQIPSEHIRVGPDYFCLRDEFLHAPAPPPVDKVKRVLISFGGVDEGNLTARVLQSVGAGLLAAGISIDVVIGFGYRWLPELKKLISSFNSGRISLVVSTRRISKYMSGADLAVTSGGRTVLELAAIGVPTLVICQNRRETYHKFASAENGIVNLGLFKEVGNTEIEQALFRLIDDPALRVTMRKRTQQHDLRKGKSRVVKAITSLLET
jgi:CMP-N-acetylneuraminic acid synthetase/spore coat polysaccharide biosynthesis predicted glycosyltransferase SpsG